MIGRLGVPGFAVLLTLMGCDEHRRIEEPANPECRTAIAVATGIVFPAECGPLLGWPFPSPSPKEITGYWSVPPETVADLERRLPEGLGQTRDVLITRRPTAENRTYVTREFDEILGRLDRYQRQYVGVELGHGRRRVLVNFSPKDDPLSPGGYGARRWVVVDDGGSSYWRIAYDPETGHFAGFDVNGGA